MTTQEKAIKLRFPSGRIGYELRYYMGMEDPRGHLIERPKIVQEMYKNGKCRQGKTSNYTIEEIIQLSKEVSHALDIKADHIDNDDFRSRWTSRDQRRLEMFGEKLSTL